MTVAEMIHLLSALPPEMRLVVYSFDGNFAQPEPPLALRLVPRHGEGVLREFLPDVDDDVTPLDAVAIMPA